MSHSLSIAIPIYNQDVSILVGSLQAQIAEIKEEVEILLFDDGSNDSFKEINRQFRSVAGVNYQEQEANIGRAAIRNRLADAAKTTHILFLDGDSLIAKSDFISSYLTQIQQSSESVICGGRNYHETPPGSEYLLHWTYGHNRESKKASRRNVNPHKGFHSNNFVIPKEVSTKIPFDEKIRQYGHEDTLMGYDLMCQGISIIHIDNPSIHGQLEDNDEFLRKTRLALNNLKSLYNRGNEEFNHWQYMLNRYRRIKKLGLDIPVGWAYTVMHKHWEKQLTGHQPPSLKIFNFYRVCYLCSL